MPNNFKLVTLIPRRTARPVKGARRAFILTLDSPSRPIESHRERSETKYSEASFRSCPVFSWWNASRSEEHTSELQSRLHLVCRLLLEKKKKCAHSASRHRSFLAPIPTTP